MNDEIEKSEKTANSGQIDRSKGLTIPANRLAGSDYCLNCDTPLSGPFCYYCGQPDKNFMRMFPVLVRDLVADLLDLDSRFIRTLKPLLLSPGKLTRDYLNGQRFRYTPPLRLYIFSSMAFFILAAMLAGGAISIGNDDSDETDTAIYFGTGDEEQLQQAHEAMDRIEPGLGDEVAQVIEEQKREQATDPSELTETTDAADEAVNSEDSEETRETRTVTKGLVINDDDEININGKPWDRETNPFIIPWMPGWVNNWVNDEIGESPQKGKEIEQNPDLIIDKVFDVLPATMFILLPLSALILKFWYLFSGRYYIEHLILALHNHSFLFVIFLFNMLLDSLAGWQDPDESRWITDAVFWANLVLFVWIPIYFLLSLKRVYEQGWALTGSKYVVVGLSYLILLLTATIAAALLSFVLL